MKVIAEHPTAEMYKSGLEIDCQCARCGSSCEPIDCAECCGEGGYSRYEEDPLWYDEDDFSTCHWCNGVGVWQHCCSGEEWCKANPLPGRENIERGSIEWFTFDSPPTP